MSQSIRIKVEGLSKRYRLGEVGTGTLSHDLNRFWHKVRGKEDPYRLVTEENDRTSSTKSKYVWAIEDINFEVKEGEVLGIIGRNGAGKSTLLKILSKVTGPTTGSVKINGRIASLLEVGTGMHPELTGKENIFLNGAILGMTKKEISAKFDDIVEFAGIAKYIDTPLKRYSSGMRVRLGFAVAAFLEPEILIVDEVLAVGDAEFQRKAVGKMKEVSTASQRTVLFVSHNMGAIRNICERCLVMDQGRIIFDGSSEEAIRTYLSLNSAEHETNLLMVENRLGNGKLKFSGIRFMDEQGVTKTETFSGDFLRICVDFVKHPDIDTQKVILALNFRDGFEEDVAYFVTDEMGVQFERISGTEGSFVLEIPKLLLRAGRYQIRLLSMYGDTRPENFLDHIESATYLEVLSTDYWNSGKNLREGTVSLMEGKLYIAEK